MLFVCSSARFMNWLVITSRRSLHASASVRNASVHVGHQAQGQDHASLAHSGHNAFAEEMGPGMLDSGAYAREMRLRHEAEVDKAKQYLDGVFPELDFPRELAQRILTHASHRDARNGHNQRLSFIGE
jgi:dsRNA-specific ribonuclease